MNHNNTFRIDVAELTLKFINNFLRWKSPLKKFNNIEKCFSINFGSKIIQGLSMISMDSNMEQSTIGGFERAENDNCFLVFIGGKDVDNIDQVLEQINIISKKIGLLPNGIIMTTEKDYIHTTYHQYPLVIFLSITKQTINF